MNSHDMDVINMDALLEDYMNNPKWAGKIFMQDEKTCYIDGLIAGAKEMQKENEQRYIDRDRAYQDLLNGWATDYRELEKENEQLKQQIDKLKEEKQYETCPYRSTDMGCDYCDYRDRDLK